MRIAHVARIQSSMALGVVALPLAVSTACDGPKPAAAADEPPAVVDGRGNSRLPKLQVPSNYRTVYEYLGSWAIAADKVRGSKELHDVYASPGTIEAYRKSGRFPDGTVLVKEVFETTTAPMTTGTVSRARALKGWFVMVKDSKNSHPGNALWGDGWGWSWFDSGNRVKTTSTNYKTDCQPCHVPARQTDWIYSNGYAPLER